MPPAHYDPQRKDWICDLCDHVTDLCTCPVYRCSVCCDDIGWDRPSGVCSVECLRIGQEQF
jgi:hypothetical protein